MPVLLFGLFSRRHLLWNMPGHEKTLYLTFDDGPVPEITPRILDILSEKGVKATFFCVGDNVRKHPGLFKRILDEGHSAGNHTFSHSDGWKTPSVDYISDVKHCRELVSSDLFRPPYGRFTLPQYFRLRKEFMFVTWSLLTRDYSPKVSPEKCLDIARKHAGPGSIIVFHDSIKAGEKVLFALPRFIDWGTEKGYRFEAIGNRWL
jgi:peptidoglycan-N-acetylglucosamine deacetylase